MSGPCSVATLACLHVAVFAQAASAFEWSPRIKRYGLHAAR